MARSVDWPALEQASPLLAALPVRARKSARALVLARSERLFSRGDRPRAMYFVISGEVHLVRHTPTGGQIILQRARAGFLAEASLNQPAYHCDAVAVAECDVLSLPATAFVDALGDEAFRSTWFTHLSRELRRVRAQAERLSLRSAPERIIHYLETEGNEDALRLSGSKKEWAAELGLTHEVLYRTLARMARDGRIRIEGLRIGLVR